MYLQDVSRVRIVSLCLNNSSECSNYIENIVFLLLCKLIYYLVSYILIFQIDNCYRRHSIPSPVSAQKASFNMTSIIHNDDSAIIKPTYIFSLTYLSYSSSVNTTGIDSSKGTEMCLCDNFALTLFFLLSEMIKITSRKGAVYSHLECQK